MASNDMPGANDNHGDRLVDEMKGKLSTFFEVFEAHFEVRDKEGVTIILACAAAHCVPGEMLWLRMIGASRAGKTELLRAIAKHPDSTEMEVVTAAAFRGGLGQKGPKILQRINGKLVIMKDLAAALTKKTEDRNELFGILRNVKNGTLTSDYGSEEGHLVQEARFDLIVATTPAIAQYRVLESLLGARFVDLQWRTGDREEMAFRAAMNNPELPEIRKAVAQAACELIDRAKVHQQRCPVSLPDADVRLLSGWADLTALLRSPIARDRQHRVTSRPAPEAGTDLAQAFRRVAEGLRLLGITDYEPYIARLAWDSIPYSRVETIRILLEKGELPGVSIREEVRAHQYDVEDMELLGIVKKAGQGYRIVPDLEPRLRVMASVHAFTP